MKAWDIIGWTADADTYCDYCADVRYGPDTDERTDSEGNDVHPIFADSEWDSDYDPLVGADLYCSGCGDVLDSILPLAMDDAIEFVTCRTSAYLQADAGAQRLFAVLGDGTTVECSTCGSNQATSRQSGSTTIRRRSVNQTRLSSFVVR
jgi:hypothetical protein